MTNRLHELTPEQVEDLINRANSFEYPWWDHDHRTVRVELRSRPGADPETWAVVEHGEVWTRNGVWEWEPRTSDRDDDFLKRARWTLAEAMEQAKEQAAVKRAYYEEIFQKKAERDRQAAALKAEQDTAAEAAEAQPTD